MKKRFTLLTLIIVCVASVAFGAAATGIISEIKAQLRPDFTVEIDGEVKQFKNVKGEVVYPVLYEGTTYLPLRAIGEIMNKTVYWYEAEKRIVLKETTVTDADVIIDTGAEQITPINPAPPESEIVLPVEPKPEVQPYSVNQDGYIGEEKAKAVALEKAGLTTADVVFDRVELDNDNGVWHYEVEFRKGLKEYDADIKAVDGSILKWEVDIDN